MYIISYIHLCGNVVVDHTFKWKQCTIVFIHLLDTFIQSYLQLRITNIRMQPSSKFPSYAILINNVEWEVNRKKVDLCSEGITEEFVTGAR